MNLSQHPELLCVRLDLSSEQALALGFEPGTVQTRHWVERAIQNHFFELGQDTFVSEGRCAIEDAQIYLLANAPAAALGELKKLFRAFPCPATSADLRRNVHLGWRDEADKIWRTFHPLTTRPFWTLLVPAAELETILEKGRAINA